MYDSVQVISFADINFSTEGVVVITALLTALSGAIAYIFKLLIKAKDDQIALALEKSQAKSYKEMLEEALMIVEARIQASGKATVKPLVAVVPEHNSPVSPEQAATAEVQTARARLTAATLALNLPVREAGKTPVGVVTEQLRADIAEVPQKVVDKIQEMDK